MPVDSTNKCRMLHAVFGASRTQALPRDVTSQHPAIRHLEHATAGWFKESSARIRLSSLIVLIVLSKVTWQIDAEQSRCDAVRFDSHPWSATLAGPQG
jgi:hypothetical protein